MHNKHIPTIQCGNDSSSPLLLQSIQSDIKRMLEQPLHLEDRGYSSASSSRLSHTRNSQLLDSCDDESDNLEFSDSIHIRSISDHTSTTGDSGISSYQLGEGSDLT